MTAWQDPPLPEGLGRGADGELAVDGLALSRLAEHYGTPLYVYSWGHVAAQLAALRAALAPVGATVCYAVKANDAHGLLARLAETGTGFDIVSGGELERVLRAGGDPGRTVFSGVGKSDAELAAALDAGVHSINIESPAEAERVAAVAAGTGRTAPVAVRVNPDVDPGTHPYIATGLSSAKFGVPAAEAAALYRRLVELEGVEPVGIACHIGSQLTRAEPLLAAVDRVLALVDELAEEGLRLERIDLGGGFGIPYGPDGQPFDLAAYGRGLAERLADRQLDVMVEPGRFLVGNAGVLVSRILYPKTTGDGTSLAVVDAAMNDLLRPALYGAHHTILPVQSAAPAAAPVTVVGPVCESADVLGHARTLPPARRGELLAVLGAGAYGSTMANTYNTRPRPAEVLVDGGRAALLRPRESIAAVLDRDRTELIWEALEVRP